jgi:hypothetical protein
MFEASKKKQLVRFLQAKLQHLLADSLKEKLWSDFFLEAGNFFLAGASFTVDVHEVTSHALTKLL